MSKLVNKIGVFRYFSNKQAINKVYWYRGESSESRTEEWKTFSQSSGCICQFVVADCVKTLVVAEVGGVPLLVKVGGTNFAKQGCYLFTYSPLV